MTSNFDALRTRILQQMAELQSMEYGSLKEEYRTNSSGGTAGPYYQLQAWHEGANLSRRVPTEEAPALKEAITNRQKFEALAEEFIEMTVEMTRKQTSAEAQKKNEFYSLAKQQEISSLMSQFLLEPVDGQRVQQLEGLVRTLIFKPATSLVGYLLQEAANKIDASYQAKPGESCKGKVSILIDCLFGSFTLERDYYHHAGKGQGHYPADAGLGLEGSYTPALARLICLEGADETGYEKAQEHLFQTGGISISARQIQRVVQRVGEPAQQWQEREGTTGHSAAPVMYISADGTGVPMRREELVGRAGKQADGSAKTRQVYLGCVFTQHKCDEKGSPIRDNDSTTYVSSFEGIHDFGPCLRREALRRGMGNVPEVVVLIDGAVGLGCMASENFKDAVQIVDFFHAMEHATEVVEALFGTGSPEGKKRQRHWAKRLLKNGVQGLIDQTRKESCGKPQAEAVEEKLGYFIKNVERMQYGTFRKKGYFIGSGVVEAGCKTVIGSRCKQSGMRWSEQGAENILALRCIHASRRTEEFWKHRLNAHAALNDPLPLAA